MKREMSRATTRRMPCGAFCWSSATSAMTALATSIVLRPDCRRTSSRNTDDAVELCVASFVGHGILDPGNIVKPGTAPASAMGEHHLLELFGGAGLGKRAHTEFALSRFGLQPPAGHQRFRFGPTPRSSAPVPTASVSMGSSCISDRQSG